MRCAWQLGHILMLRLPLRAVLRMFTAIALAMIAAIYLWVYFTYSLAMEAMEGGLPLSSDRVAIRSIIPVFIALFYCVWVFLRHAASSRDSIRSCLREGILFRWDTRQRCLSVFDWLVRPHDQLPREMRSSWAKRYQHSAWVWGAKPALIGLLAVLSASPLLLVSPIVGEIMDLDINLNGVFILAAVLWAAATAAYLTARKTGYLDENDRTPSKRAAIEMKKARASAQRGEGIEKDSGASITDERRQTQMSEQNGGDVDRYPRLSIAETARDLLSKASAHFQAREDEDALLLYRQALRTALGEFQHSQHGELLHLSLLAYRGIAVAALTTGRNGEAAVAIETGIASAELGLRHWPDAPPLLEERSELSTLKEKTGLTGYVYIPEDFSQWISDD